MSTPSLPATEREALVHECVPLVKRLARRLSARLPNHIDVRDLVQAGFVALLEALDKFEPDRGVHFWSYAETRVWGAMLDSLRRLDPLPRSLRRMHRTVEQMLQRLQGELGRAPSDAELAERLGMDLETLARTLDEIRGLLLGLRLADRGVDMIQFLADEKALDPFVVVERDEMRQHLASAIAALPERDQLLISLYYKDELTMKEIGGVLDVNESRVSQLHTRAVLRLRAQLASRLGVELEEPAEGKPRANNGKQRSQP